SLRRAVLERRDCHVNVVHVTGLAVRRSIRRVVAIAQIEALAVAGGVCVDWRGRPELRGPDASGRRRSSARDGLPRGRLRVERQRDRYQVAVPVGARPEEVTIAGTRETGCADSAQVVRVIADLDALKIRARVQRVE